MLKLLFSFVYPEGVLQQKLHEELAANLRAMREEKYPIILKLSHNPTVLQVQEVHRASTNIVVMAQNHC